MKQRKTRKILTAMLCGIVAFACVMPSAFATETTPAPLPEGPAVLYEGGAEHFVFVPESTDLFENFKNVIPGDVITQSITVKNTTKNKKISIYMRAEPVREEYVDFLSYMTLTVMQDGERVITDAGAHEQGGLAENVLLGTFIPNEGADLDVQLAVSLEMGNEHQLDYGEIVWVFTVEEMDYNSPQTGDDTDLRPYVIALAVAVIVGVYVWSRLKKEKKKKQEPDTKGTAEEQEDVDIHDENDV